MLVIRLQRVGRKNDPSFRIVVMDSRKAAKSGRVIEVVGNYDARQGKPSIKGERVKHYMALGGRPSETVHNLLVDAKIITGKKVNALNSKTPIKKEVPPEASKAEAPAEAAPAEAEPAPVA
jgi:small subunit ribosomal protein S16